MPPSEEFWTTPLAFAIVAGVAGAVVGPLFFWVRGRRLLPTQRLRRGDWSGRDVWLAFFLWLLVPSLAIGLLESLGFYEANFDTPPSPLRMALWASPLAVLLTLALVFWVLFQTSRTRPSHLGLTCARWRQNTALGYLAFLLLTPLILGFYFLIQLLLSLAFDTSPMEHPIKKLSEESLITPEWVLLMGEAILVASLLEELMFRGVLQGWLRRCSLSGHIMMILVTLGWGMYVLLTSLFPLPDQPARDVSAGPLVFAGIMAVGYGFALQRFWTPGRD
ncbi:MAG TPA: CPBP family glutamic-type intramembrane protease, partial [Gemmataceae bacterium]|nr:CPBP family glutamic-type intramembrane protease [Gemmataceae bacterium]